MRWLLTMQLLRNGIGRTTRQLSQNAARDKRSFVAYAKRALVSHRGSRLSHVRRDKLR